MESLRQAENRGAQESAFEIARTTSAGGDTWSYTAGAYPALDRELEQRAAMSGAVWSPHLVGKDFISFGEFIEREEILQFLNKLFPTGSDQSFALGWLRERTKEFLGDRNASRAKLTELIRACPLFEARGYRHVQNAFGAIFDQYDDLLKKQQRNLKLSEDWLRREQRRKAYEQRERKRKAKRIWVAAHCTLRDQNGAGGELTS
jgi:hypothetical protein